MIQPNHSIKQLAEEFQLPDVGKQSEVLLENSKTKAILFTFAPGSGLAEHVAPFDATIQVISGTARITVMNETIEGKPGTWIHMLAQTPHSIKAETPLMMLLTLVK